MTDPRSNPSHSSTAEWERLSTLFEAAQSLPPESREQYLDAVCQANPTLRAELEALLASAHDAPAFLRDLAATAVAPVFERVVSAEPEKELDTSDVIAPISLTGTKIRHYDVLDRVGGGGMGVVYLGRDTRLNRDVALKFLSPSRFADVHARRQLVREAQAVSALDDPHVCAMHAIEDTDDGGVCLVMAYCAGGTLRERLRRRLPPIDEALRIATQIASGLACAHRRGIVHRDLKPANIGFADRDIVKILDFGVAARTLDYATTGVPSLAGTLPYMAPELLRGEVPDARADVWALGVTFYELLTGRRPFVGPTDASVLYAILEQEPAPLARADGEAIPEPIVGLLRDLLQKAPALRPANGAAVFERLQVMGGKDTQAPPLPDHSNSAHGTVARQPPVEHSRSPGPRTQRTMPALAALLLLTSIGGAWLFSRRERGRDTVVPPLEIARSAAPLPTIAVLPFVIQGAPDLGYLYEGMVDLLTPAFDATGLVRGVDPNAVIGADTRPAPNGARNGRIDSAMAQGWAERVGASRYVVGSVVRAGDGLTLRATMYFANGAERGRAQFAIANAAAIASAVDGLVRQLVSAELRAPGDTLSALAASTTTSAIALRAYLDGERELRDARPAAAVEFFQQAVAADSMFAIAWYRLARAAKWNEVDSLNRFATARAFTLASSLPLRLQSIVRAYHAERMGSPRDAERSLKRIVADYPTDVEAWMLLGEVLFETNPYNGRSSDEATAAFRTVMRLDPRNREVTVYLMELAARSNRAGELDTLFTMYFSPNSAGEQPGIRQTYLALHARRVTSSAARSTSRAVAAQRANAQLDDPSSALIALRRAGSDTRDLAAATTFARSVVSASDTPEARLEGLLSLASLSAAAGQRDSALAQWRGAEQLDPTSTLVAQTLVALSPASPVGDDSLGVWRQRLVRAAAANDRPGTGWDRTRLTVADQKAVLRYLVGLASVQLGDQETADRAVRQLLSSTSDSPLAPVLARAVRGHQALARQQYREAVMAFAAGFVDMPARTRTLVPALQQLPDRVAYASALRALGRPDAAAWQASLGDGPAVWSAPFLARPREE